MAEEREYDEYDLKGSSSKIGYLFPVLLDPQGRIIDGNHRLKANPAWPVQQKPEIDSNLKYHIARLVANFMRRNMTAKEIKAELEEIATISGWTPKQIAKETGVSYRTVLRYLPDEFKEQEKQRFPILPPSGGKPNEKKVGGKPLKPFERPTIVYDPEYAKKRYIEDLAPNLWFLPPGSPVYEALCIFCVGNKVMWQDAVEQLLTESLKSKGYI